MAKILDKDDLVLHIVKELTAAERKTSAMFGKENQMETNTDKEKAAKKHAIQQRHLIIDELQGKLMAANFKLIMLTRNNDEVKYSNAEYELFNEQIAFFCNRLRNGKSLNEVIGASLPNQKPYQILLTTGFIEAIKMADSIDSTILSMYHRYDKRPDIKWDEIQAVLNEYDQYKNWIQPKWWQNLGRGIATGAKILFSPLIPLIYPFYRFVKEIQKGIKGYTSGFVAAGLEILVAGAGGVGGYIAGAMAGAALGSLIPIPIIGSIVGATLGALFAADIFAFAFKQFRRLGNYLMHGTTSPQYHIELEGGENTTYMQNIPSNVRTLQFLLREIKNDPEMSSDCKADCKAMINTLKELKFERAGNRDSLVVDENVTNPVKKLSDQGISFLWDATMGAHLLTFDGKAGVNYKPFAQEKNSLGAPLNTTSLHVDTNTHTLSLGG